MLSYCWDEKELVSQIYEALMGKGLKVWIDQKCMSGELYEKMYDAVKTSTIFLPCLSSGYHNSDNCKRELNFAADQKKIMIPIKFDDFEGPMDFVISGKIYYYFNKDLSNFHNKVDALYEDIVKNLHGENKGI